MPERRIPELDGIRGIAILFVLVYHFGYNPALPNALFQASKLGWAGVDLFFVLSGFLITGILLKAKGRPGYFSTFYWHRTLRIFPLYYSFLLVSLPFAPLVPQLGYWVYLGNFLNAFGHSIPFMNHLWSLAIEEQFYAIWPLIVLWLPSRRLAWFSVVTICFVIVARAITSHFHTPGAEFIYKFTPLRCDALLFGALVAILHHHSVLLRITSQLKLAAVAGAVLLTIAIGRAHGTSFMNPNIERYGYLGVDLLSAAIIGLSVIWSGTPRLALLRAGVLRFFGKYSYGIYVLHFPIALILGPWLAARMNPASATLTSLVIGSSLSVAAALISWNVLEKRLLSLKNRGVSRSRTALAA